MKTDLRDAADISPDSLSIDEYLVRNPSKTVLIKVQGDSMIDAGIHASDIVVVEKQRTAKVAISWSQSWMANLL